MLCKGDWAYIYVASVGVYTERVVPLDKPRECNNRLVFANMLLITYT